MHDPYESSSWLKFVINIAQVRVKCVSSSSSDIEMCTNHIAQQSVRIINTHAEIRCLKTRRPQERKKNVSRVCVLVCVCVGGWVRVCVA